MSGLALREACVYALLNGVSVKEAFERLAAKEPHTLIRDRPFVSGGAA